MKEVERLAAFVAEGTFDSLPPAVVERAKWVLRDTVGVIVGGMAEPEVRALAGYAVENAPGGATLLGHGGRVTPAWAALVHGTAGTTLEMDEGHAFARGHAAIHAVPPAISLAESWGENRRGASGREAIVALVVGYEVAARAGVATRLRKAVHPFGAWGVLGAAAIAARFKRMEAREVAGTMELAASYAITPSFETAYQGATVRNTYAGVVNRLGMLAADLYELGFRGEAGGLRTAFGEILGHSFDPSALSDGLGERYEIMRGYFKPYSGCRYTHASIDAVLALQEEEAVDVNDLRAVEVATYDIAAHLANPAPATPLAGRFSLPYVVAATLANGSAGPEIFTPQMLADPSILDLAARVSVSEDEAFTSMTPARRPARIVLHYADGGRRERTVTGSKGDPDQPMTAGELEVKFRGLCDPIIGRDKAQRAWNDLGRVEQLAGLDAITRLLVPKGGD
jgi:2-methylcitrate dehydratase PrpD